MDAFLNAALPLPSLAEIERIASISDPVIRNLQITQCYHELSVTLAARLGQDANWCTFATWASKQAGQTIRKEDLSRLLARRVSASPAAVQAAEQLRVAAPQAEVELSPVHPGAFLEQGIFHTAGALASDAVGRGNLKVFAEIGREFARFCATCLPDESYNPVTITQFCEQFRPGGPPDGQDYLRGAFTHYYQALFESDHKSRAELLMLANIEVGYHEQTRLQPEIAESLEAGLTSAVRFSRQVLARLFPFGGWFALAHQYLRRILGRPTKLDQAIDVLFTTTRYHLRQILTESMLAIQLPSGRRLSLAADLAGSFPGNLQRLTNPELAQLLAQLDPTPDSLVDSGALDWADLQDRIHFIIDFFRCYQETPDLFLAPFTPAQVATLKAGLLPGGVL